MIVLSDNCWSIGGELLIQGGLLHRFIGGLLIVLLADKIDSFNDQ